jgi:hypothetical protein
MPPRRTRSSRRIQRIQDARQQRRLAEHLREIEAEQIWAGEPRRSLRLHFQFAPGFRYWIFGEEGYVLQNNRFEGREFPTFEWRANRGQLDACRGTRNKGDNESVQGADPQEALEGNNVPAINDAAGSILHEEDNRSKQGDEPPRVRVHFGRHQASNRGATGGNQQRKGKRTPRQAGGQERASHQCPG